METAYLNIRPIELQGAARKMAESNCTLTVNRTTNEKGVPRGTPQENGVPDAI